MGYDLLMKLDFKQRSMPYIYHTSFYDLHELSDFTGNNSVDNNLLTCHSHNYVSKALPIL